MCVYTYIHTYIYIYYFLYVDTFLSELPYFSTHFANLCQLASESLRLFSRAATWFQPMASSRFSLPSCWNHSWFSGMVLGQLNVGGFQAKASEKILWNSSHPRSSYTVPAQDYSSCSFPKGCAWQEEHSPAFACASSSQAGNEMLWSFPEIGLPPIFIHF